MRSIDGTLFDYGHTLAYLPRIERTHDVAAKNIRRLVSNLGIQAEDTRIKELINEYAQGPREVVSIREEFSQILATLGVDNFNEADLLESIRVHGSPYIQNARIRRGAKELLQLLKNRGIRTGIVTNSPGAYLIDPVLERERIRKLFDAVVVSADVGVRKPDPRIFQLALKKLGLRFHNLYNSYRPEGFDLWSQEEQQETEQERRNGGLLRQELAY